MTARPLVTVLIDTYNHERLIEEALVSVLEQDFPAGEMEILVVDDGSTDQTPEIVRKFAPRVRLLRKSNGGQASAFNAGIPEARGEIISFLDGDDWWTRDKLTRVMRAIASDPSVGILGHGITIVHRDGNMEAETLRDGFRFQANTLEGAHLFSVRASFLGTSRMTIRAEILRRIGPVPAPLVVQADEYIFTLASVMSGVQILPEPLTYYRMHDANGFQISGNHPLRHRRKMEALEALACGLAAKLETVEMEPEARAFLLTIARANADQLRLRIDGGWPWETARTEWRIYSVNHPDAPLPHRIFKSFFLAGACVAPPRLFYSLQTKLSQSDLYRSVRRRFLPIPRMMHLQRDLRAGSRKSE
ncbi:MAG TPA: glycosyltransferase [Candidatus Acidoferrales bacterium]